MGLDNLGRYFFTVPLRSLALLFLTRALVFPTIAETRECLVALWPKLLAFSIAWSDCAREHGDWREFILTLYVPGPLSVKYARECAKWIDLRFYYFFYSQWKGERIVPCEISRVCYWWWNERVVGPFATKISRLSLFFLVSLLREHG